MKTENQDIRGNRKHKDALFRMVFSKKEDLLDLYNAVRGTAYQNAEDPEVNTLENVLYMAMKNDVYCVLQWHERRTGSSDPKAFGCISYRRRLYRMRSYHVEYQFGA